METKEFVRHAGEGDLLAVKRFIVAGGDPNAIDTKGRSALIEATKKNQLSVVEYLLQKGAETDARDSGQLTALSLAEAHGKADVVRVLKRVGAL